MAGFSDTTEAAILALIFNATAWGNYADNAATSPQTNIAVALHTADPADAGTMSTSETTYTSYARASVARTTGGWTVSGTSPTQVAPVATIAFAAGTGGSGTVTNFSTGKTGGGAAAIIMAGTVVPNITVGSGVTPQLSTSSVCTLD
jgi:hypothetical protein